MGVSVGISLAIRVSNIETPLSTTFRCSLAASILFSIGFGAFSFSLMAQARPYELAPMARHSLLVLYFFLAGLGTVNS